PHRERNFANLKQLIISGNVETQSNHFSLIGSSTADYSKIEELLSFLIHKGFRFTLPSIRIDSGKDILNLISQSGQKSLTIAPEAGSTETRFVVGKRITNEQITSFTLKANQSGISQIKTYFILGLTSDVETEVKAIGDLMTNLKQENSGMKFNISITPLVPKKGTKFGNRCIDYTSISNGVKFLKKNLSSDLKYKVFPTRWAVIQAILSVGGRELTPIMEELAARDGSYQAWKKTMRANPEEFYRQNYCE
ncbi:MAG: radical SAM protein, partial [Promethearchaeota archaeon]